MLHACIRLLFFQIFNKTLTIALLTDAQVKINMSMDKIISFPFIIHHSNHDCHHHYFISYIYEHDHRKNFCLNFDASCFEDCEFFCTA